MDTNTDTGIRSTRLWQVARRAKAATLNGAFETILRRRILPGPFRLAVVAGQKRAGNHVFINWFLSQGHGPCAFFNHVRPNLYPTQKFRREFRVNRLRALPTVVFSYEDRTLDEIFDGPLQEFIARYEDRIQDRTLALMLRDPRNMMASRFKKWPEEYENADLADGVIGQWSDYVTAAIDGRGPDDSFRVVPVYYNHFVTYPGYRSRLAEALGVRDGAAGLDTVPDYGHGSSFSGTSEVDRKGIFERWKSYEADPAFARLFADGEVLRLGDALDRTTFPEADRPAAP